MNENASTRQVTKAKIAAMSGALHATRAPRRHHLLRPPVRRSTRAKPTRSPSVCVINLNILEKTAASGGIDKCLNRPEFNVGGVTDASGCGRRPECTG